MAFESTLLIRWNAEIAYSGLSVRFKNKQSAETTLGLLLEGLHCFQWVLRQHANANYDAKMPCQVTATRPLPLVVQTSTTS